jgi:UDP-N-acetylmuramate dehydrogenase
MTVTGVIEPSGTAGEERMNAEKNRTLQKVFEILKGDFRGDLIPGADLSRFNSFALKAGCECFAIPADVESAARLIAACRRLDHPVRFLGGGTNVILSRDPVTGIVLFLSRMRGTLEREGTCLRASGGLALQHLIHFAMSQGLGGLEFMAGIPGTIGAAVAGNAGGREEWIGEFVTSVKAIDRDGVIDDHAPSIDNFRYRGSSFKDRHQAICEVELTLKEREPVMLRETYTACHRRKAETQPLGCPCAGCIFRNPPGESAGRLIDSCGLKGFRVGGAEVSEIHGNFIVNNRDAAPSDVLTLIDRIRETVLREKGIELELEVDIW